MQEWDVGGEGEANKGYAVGVRRTSGESHQYFSTTSSARSEIPSSNVNKHPPKLRTKLQAERD